MNDEIKRYLESHVESTMTNKTELRSAYIELSENFTDTLKEVMRYEGYCVDNARNFNIEDMEYDVDVRPSIGIEKAVELLAIELLTVGLLTNDHGYIDLDEYRTVEELDSVLDEYKTAQVIVGNDAQLEADIELLTDLFKWNDEHPTVTWLEIQLEDYVDEEVIKVILEQNPDIVQDRLREIELDLDPEEQELFDGTYEVENVKIAPYSDIADVMFDRIDMSDVEAFVTNENTLIQIAENPRLVSYDLDIS